MPRIEKLEDGTFKKVKTEIEKFLENTIGDNYINLSNQIVEEANIRSAEDELIRNSIDNIEEKHDQQHAELVSNLEDEIQSRVQEDDTLHNRIDQEETTRISADDSLQTEIDNLDQDINNLESDFNAHTHDNRYYLQSEIDNKLNNKANLNHNHSGDDITSAVAQADNAAALNNKSASYFASTSHDHDGIYLKQTGGIVHGDLTVTGELSADNTSSVNRNVTAGNNYILASKEDLDVAAYDRERHGFHMLCNGTVTVDMNVRTSDDVRWEITKNGNTVKEGYNDAQVNVDVSAGDEITVKYRTIADASNDLRTKIKTNTMPLRLVY